MKKLCLILMLLTMFCMGCDSNRGSDEVLNFIPGTYIRESQGEFGKSYDTVAITLQNKAVNQFKIVRRWRYDRVLDGKALEPEYKITETSGIYDDKKNVLQESETLDKFTFDTKKNLLFDGTNQFIKIK